MNKLVTRSQDLSKLLDLAIKQEGADKGTLQRYNPALNELEVVAAHGFSKEFLKHFKSVKPFDSSCCGRAFGVGSTIVISDVKLDQGFAPNLNVAKQESFRAVKSIPIYDSEGGKCGVISVHFSSPKWNWDFKKAELVLPKLAEALMNFSFK